MVEDSTQLYALESLESLKSLPAFAARSLFSAELLVRTRLKNI